MKLEREFRFWRSSLRSKCAVAMRGVLDVFQIARDRVKTSLEPRRGRKQRSDWRNAVREEGLRNGACIPCYNSGHTQQLICAFQWNSGACYHELPAQFDGSARYAAVRSMLRAHLFFFLEKVVSNTANALAIS